MIAEKLNIRFDIQRIQDYFTQRVKPLAPVQQNEMFGGWSILSANGDYRDGFQQTEERFYLRDPISGEYRFDYERAHREIGYTWPKMHINPTAVGGEYIAEIIAAIDHLGLQPHHARWTRIAPGGTTIWHRDTWENTYKVRLHIPVFTNPGCAFETEAGKVHMPADGSCYLVAVNCLHKAYNHGTEERIHIIMDVIDDVGVSQYHRSPQCSLSNTRWGKSSLFRMLKRMLRF